MESKKDGYIPKVSTSYEDYMAKLRKDNEKIIADKLAAATGTPSGKPEVPQTKYVPPPTYNTFKPTVKPTIKYSYDDYAKHLNSSGAGRRVVRTTVTKDAAPLSDEAPVAADSSFKWDTPYNGQAIYIDENVIAPDSPIPPVFTDTTIRKFDTVDFIDPNNGGVCRGSVIETGGELAAVKWYRDGKEMKHTFNRKALSKVSKATTIAPRTDVNHYDNAIKAIKNYREINFYANPSDYSFNNHFYSVGIYNADIFMVYKNYTGTDNIDLRSEVAEDIMAYVPVDYAAINHYDEDFVRWYVDVINSLGFGEIKLVGIVEAEYFKDYKNTTYYAGLMGENKHYQFHITGDYSQLKLLAYKLLSFLYHREHTNIPGIVRNLLEDRVTADAWQAFLLATIIVNKTTLCYSGLQSLKFNDCGVIPDIFEERNSLDAFKKRYMSEKYINNCFKYQVVDYRDFKKLTIATRKQINNYITNYKNLFL